MSPVTCLPAGPASSVVRSFEIGDVEERIDRLEQLIADFVTNVGIEFNKLYNSQLRTEAELREFKGEMKDFKDEMNLRCLSVGTRKSNSSVPTGG